MGLYNYWAGKLPAPLESNCCLICDQLMRPFNKDPEKDAFQYKCDTCNPRLVIEISGSLLASSLYEKIYNNQDVKRRIQRKIRTSVDNRFAITTSFASQYV